MLLPVLAVVELGLCRDTQSRAAVSASFNGLALSHQPPTLLAEGLINILAVKLRLDTQPFLSHA